MRYYNLQDLNIYIYIDIGRAWDKTFGPNVAPPLDVCIKDAFVCHITPVQ